MLIREAADMDAAQFSHEADFFYSGQSHTVRLPVSCPGFNAAVAEQHFAEAYETRFGIRLDEMTPMILNLRTTATGKRPKPSLHALAPVAKRPQDAAKIGNRQVYFDEHWMPAAIYDRDALPVGAKILGPAVIEQLDSTTVIDPGAALRIDKFGNLLINVGSGALA